MPDESFATRVRAALTDYRGEPSVFDGQSVPYARAVVSAFNSAMGTSYSVFTSGRKIIVGLRADCRRYLAAPPAETPDLVALLSQALELARGSVAPLAASRPLTALEHMELAVEMNRHGMLSGDEMRAQLNGLLNANDDLL